MTETLTPFALGTRLMLKPVPHLAPYQRVLRYVVKEGPAGKVTVLLDEPGSALSFTYTPDEAARLFVPAVD